MRNKCGNFIKSIGDQLRGRLQSSGAGGGGKQSQTSLTPEIVTAAYNILLDRSPENQGVIAEKLEQCATIKELRDILLGSEEYERNNPLETSKIFSGMQPALNINLDPSPADLQRLFDHVQKTWQLLGQTDPYWSVITADDFKSDSAREKQQMFYDSGRPDALRLIRTMERNNIDPAQFETCLDFGCGIGRILHFLSKRFRLVYGYDISKAHLAIAEEQLSRMGIANYKLHHLQQISDLEALPAVDVIFSVIVLQHNPPPVIGYAVKSFLNALNPGGVAYFQIPTYQNDYQFILEDYLKENAEMHEMEMHVFPQPIVFKLVEQAGCRLVEVLEDNCTGADFNGLSNTFLVQKKQ